MNRNNQDDLEYSRKLMQWYGWGSPVGVGIFLVCTGGLLYLLHLAGLL